MRNAAASESLKKANATIKTPVFITLNKTSHGYVIANNRNIFLKNKLQVFNTGFLL